MALYTVSGGGVVNALDVDQFYNLLTGVMTDQPVTIANRLRATNTGASTACGFMGGTAGGPPTTGTFAAGDLVIDTVYGGHWVCTTGGTPGTWTPNMMGISLQTLGSPVSSVTFSSIPQNFNHLMIVMTAQSSAAVSFADVGLRFNGDTGANYAGQTWDGVSNLTTLSAAFNSSQTSMSLVLLVPGTSGLNATNRIGSGSALIPRYSSANFTKMAWADSYAGDGGASAWSRHRYGQWVSTAAITSVTVLCGSGNFTTNSFIGLYGMP